MTNEKTLPAIFLCELLLRICGYIGKYIFPPLQKAIANCDSEVFTTICICIVISIALLIKYFFDSYRSHRQKG
jgi:Kef-type K+ transport system membrane component KefB